MLVLYAVVPARHPSPAAGTTGQPLDVVSDGPVGVVVEQRDEPLPADRPTLLAFGETVQRLAEATTVLPVRFGTTVPDREALRQLLRENAARWQARLQAVTDKVEMVVHADVGEALPDPAGDRASGRAYLLARADAVHRAEAVTAGLLAALRPVSHEQRLLRGRGGETRVACLVGQAEVQRVERALADWSSAGEGRTAHITGPWPPFSFTEEEPES